jgi:GntR family transcriptional regulator
VAELLVYKPNWGAGALGVLDTAGVVTKRRTAGTYVSRRGSPLDRRERLKILSERVDALLAEARQMNVNIDQVFALIRRREEKMQPGAKQE